MTPIDGTLAIEAAAGLPVASDLAKEPLVLEGAELLHVMFEIDSSGVIDRLPAALHPTDPTIVTFVFIHSTGGALGSFTLAQERIGCRAGVRPRGYVVASVIDGPDAGSAGEALARGWGIGTTRGEIEFVRGYHEIRGTAADFVDCALVDPRPLSGAEIQFAASMQLASVGGKPRLVQVDPELTYQRASCGRPRLDGYAGEGSPVYPVSAWWTLCDLSLPRIRYILDPNVTALQGTEKIG